MLRGLVPARSKKNQVDPSQSSCGPNLYYAKPQNKITNTNFRRPSHRPCLENAGPVPQKTKRRKSFHSGPNFYYVNHPNQQKLSLKRPSRGCVPEFSRQGPWDGLLKRIVCLLLVVLHNKR